MKLILQTIVDSVGLLIFLVAALIACVLAPAIILELVP